MVRSMLPPGFRFHPTDVELVMYYLKRKVMGKKLIFEAITELNIYKFSPWDLPGMSLLKMKDLEWFFFCPRERKYASGVRMNRATETGYWKTTGKDRPVLYNGNVVGKVRTLVFHLGSPPHGKRTDWVIHEYRLEDQNLADKGVAQDTYVLCKVFHKNGPGPKNGAQYGAPFQEEEWDDDSEIPPDSLTPNGPFPFAVDLQQNQNSSTALRIVEPGQSSGLSLSEPGPSVVRPLRDEVLLNGQNSSMLTGTVDANTCGWSLSEAGASFASLSAQDTIPDAGNDDLAHLLASFKDDDDAFPLTADANEVAHLDQAREIQLAPNPNFDGSDPFSGLEDLNVLSGVNGGGHYFSDMEFLEVDDLNAPLNFSTDSFGFREVQTNGFLRPCISNGSQHTLPQCAVSNSNDVSRQVQHQGNFPWWDTRLINSIQLPSLPDSSHNQGNPATVAPLGNIYNPTWTTHGVNLSSFIPEESQSCREAGKR
ncbi:OLC1v1008587C2 [Oldenlandia corymbosa var. corymbosa]|nr:OLC1v1008587C2 [Oldenlandia corymbosa var. corymbosa]